MQESEFFVPLIVWGILNVLGGVVFSYLALLSKAEKRYNKFVVAILAIFIAVPVLIGFITLLPLLKYANTETVQLVFFYIGFLAAAIWAFYLGVSLIKKIKLYYISIARKIPKISLLPGKQIRSLSFGKAFTDYRVGYILLYIVLSLCYTIWYSDFLETSFFKPAWIGDIVRGFFGIIAFIILVFVPYYIKDSMQYKSDVKYGMGKFIMFLLVTVAYGITACIAWENKEVLVAIIMGYSLFFIGLLGRF